ncbi:MAG: calcium/sodium antiporter [Bacteroidales bacterium]|nr:calcium/sodium antiporter [Bacteroidales bacterium]
MIINILLLITGFALVIKGADFLVDGASSLAKRFKVSELAIGLTVVAFGTSAPELVVNVIASYQHHDEVVFGNIIGSNIFNLLMILGISGIIYPIVVQVKTVWKEIPFSLAAALILLVLVNDSIFFSNKSNLLQRTDGIILLVFFLAFLVYVFYNMKEEPLQNLNDIKVMSGLRTTIYILLGLAGLIFGGRMVVTYAVKIATLLSVSEKLIGLTIVSVGTSLPELATSAVAAYKKRSDLAMGNIIGSNIFNIFLILGVSALISPVKFNTVLNTDIYVLILSTLFLFLAMFTGVRKKLDRWEAALMLLFFIGYLSFLIWRK